MDRLTQLSTNELQSIASALRAGRLSIPLSAITLQRYVSPAIAGPLAADINELAQNRMTSLQMASILEWLVQDRMNRAAPEEIIQLVTTGPEAGAVTNRDTSVVVQELFKNARQTALVAGYAVYRGHRVFQALADRMLANPDLEVRMFLDVRRPVGDTTIPQDILRRFRENFRQNDWPPDRPLPSVYYYPLSLEESAERRASLHAKCVVVDKESVFVSSANFTEAAQNRNIEVGLLIQSHHLARKIADHFEALVEQGVVKSIPGLSQNPSGQ